MNAVNTSILGLLSRFRGRRITVHLKSQSKIVGRLVDLDDRLNLLLDEAEEATGDDPAMHYGKILIRGNTIGIIQLPEYFASNLAFSLPDVLL